MDRTADRMNMPLANTLIVSADPGAAITKEINSARERQETIIAAVGLAETDAQARTSDIILMPGTQGMSHRWNIMDEVGKEADAERVAYALMSISRDADPKQRAQEAAGVRLLTKSITDVLAMDSKDRNGSKLYEAAGNVRPELKDVAELVQSRIGWVKEMNEIEGPSFSLSRLIHKGQGQEQAASADTPAGSVWVVEDHLNSRGHSYMSAAVMALAADEIQERTPGESHSAVRLIPGNVSRLPPVDRLFRALEKLPERGASAAVAVSSVEDAEKRYNNAEMAQLFNGSRVVVVSGSSKKMDAATADLATRLIGSSPNLISRNRTPADLTAEIGRLKPDQAYRRTGGLVYLEHLPVDERHSAPPAGITIGGVARREDDYSHVKILSADPQPVLDEIGAQVRERGEGLIAVVQDLKQTEKLYNPQSDVIFSSRRPNEYRWSPVKEMRTPADASDLSRAMISDRGEDSIPEFTRTFVTDVMTKLWEKSRTNEARQAGQPRPDSVAALRKHLTRSSREELGELLGQTASAAFLDTKTDLFDKIREHASEQTAWLEKLDTGKGSYISLREAGERGVVGTRGAVFIHASEEHPNMARTLLTAARAGTLHRDSSAENVPVWYMHSDMSQETQDSWTMDFMTRARKVQGKVVAGITNVSRMEKNQGRHPTSVFLENTSSTVILGSDRPMDRSTAETAAGFADHGKDPSLPERYQRLRAQEGMVQRDGRWHSVQMAGQTAEPKVHQGMSTKARGAVLQTWSAPPPVQADSSAGRVQHSR